MNKRKRYFVKQKLIGVILVLLGIVSIFVSENNDATAALLVVPMGCLCIFTKDMVITDDYWFECKSKMEERENKRL